MPEGANKGTKSTGRARSQAAPQPGGMWYSRRVPPRHLGKGSSLSRGRRKQREKVGPELAKSLGQPPGPPGVRLGSHREAKAWGFCFTQPSKDRKVLGQIPKLPGPGMTPVLTSPVFQAVVRICYYDGASLSTVSQAK